MPSDTDTDNRGSSASADAPSNPPAFPVSTIDGFTEYGMTLRDWFAGQAIGGIAGRDSYDCGQATPQQRARLPYIEADAMLAERERRS